MFASRRPPLSIFLLCIVPGCALEEPTTDAEPGEHAHRASDRTEVRTAPDDSDALTARMIAGVGTDEIRDGDLRPETLELLEAADRGEVELYEERAGASSDYLAHLVVPSEIRVWRRSRGGPSASCAAAREGYVETIPIEDYVKGVLPHEWIRSWAYESQKAGAIIIRTYATYHALGGGKYTCADVDDTVASQVYKDERYEKTDRAVDETAGLYVVNGSHDRLRFTEYSAENGDPTRDGVRDAHCTGKSRFGHGRGACQWGTARWANRSGKDYDWIIRHYFPGSQVAQLRDRDGKGDSSYDHEAMDNEEIARGGCSTAGDAAASLYLVPILIGLLGRRRTRS